MKKVHVLWRTILALALVASMLGALLPAASAEDLLGGLGAMISGLLDKDAGSADKTEEESSEPADFYEAMDSYEAFFDAYVEYMKNFDESELSDLGVLADYTEMMTRYADTMEKLDDIDEDELTDDELAYYIDVMARINKKLLELT